MQEYISVSNKSLSKKKAPAAKGAANAPHDGLRSHFGEPYKVWPYELLQWDVFKTLLLKKLLGIIGVHSQTLQLDTPLTGPSWSSDFGTDCMGLGSCSQRLCLWAKIFWNWSDAATGTRHAESWQTCKVFAWFLTLPYHPPCHKRRAFGIHLTLGTSMDLCPSQRFGPPLATDEFLSHNGSKHIQQCSLRFQIILMIYNRIRCYIHGFCDCIVIYIYI